MAKTHAVVNTKNSKLVSAIEGKAWQRPISSTSRTADTCAPDCPFLDKGQHVDSDNVPICYANEKIGRPSIFQMADKHGVESSKAALDKIRFGAPANSALRHLVAGDVASPNDDYINAANELHRLRSDLQGWGYTHNWRRMNPTDAKGWTLNASTETPEEAEEAIGKGWQAVIESPADASLAGTRIAGRRVVSCPNQSTHGQVGCADCNLCRNDTPTRPIVEFEIHGSSKAGKEEVENRVRTARDASAPVSLGMPTVRKAKTEDFKEGFSDRAPE